MAPNTSIDYAEIRRVAQRLDDLANDIVPHIVSAKSEVQALFQGGLYMEKASPAMREAYEQFDSQLNMAIQGLPNWGNQLRGIATSMEENDIKMAAEIRANTASAGKG